MSSGDVRARCLAGGRAVAAAHVPQDAPAALLPLPEGGQPGVGAGEEAAPAWRAAQPTAHQTHPHILSVSHSVSGPMSPHSYFLTCQFRNADLALRKVCVKTQTSAKQPFVKRSTHAVLSFIVFLHVDSQESGVKIKILQIGRKQ